MSIIQKQMLIKLHKILVTNNLFFAAQGVLQVLIKNNIPTKLNLVILRIHLLSVFSIHSVEANFPKV